MSLNNNFIKFHHLAIAVRSFEKSIVFYKTLGYNCSEIVIDSIQNVNLVFCKAVNFPNIELVSPINEKSPVYSILKGKDTQIYHQCYQTTDLKKAIDLLKNNNKILCISPPKPAILFQNRRVSFYNVSNVGLIEILETDIYD
ncbi:MAG: VOC family protein [Bacteroidales bacterium]